MLVLKLPPGGLALTSTTSSPTGLAKLNSESGAMYWLTNPKWVRGLAGPTAAEVGLSRPLLLLTNDSVMTVSCGSAWALNCEVQSLALRVRSRFGFEDTNGSLSNWNTFA